MFGICAKVAAALAALEAAAPGGFANASQGLLTASVKADKRFKEAEMEEALEEPGHAEGEGGGKCRGKPKAKGRGKGTGGRGPVGPAVQTASADAFRIAFQQALKTVSLPKDSQTVGIADSKKHQAKVPKTQRQPGRTGGSDDQTAGVEPALTLAAVQAEPHEATTLLMDIVATCEGDAADGNAAKDTKESATKGSASEDEAYLGISGFALGQRLPPPVGAKSSALLAAADAVEVPSAPAAPAQTTSSSDAASEAPDSCCCVFWFLLRIGLRSCKVLLVLYIRCQHVETERLAWPWSWPCLASPAGTLTPRP